MTSLATTFRLPLFLTYPHIAVLSNPETREGKLRQALRRELGERVHTKYLGTYLGPPCDVPKAPTQDSGQELRVCLSASSALATSTFVGLTLLA
jgi:hypothetical protein